MIRSMLFRTEASYGHNAKSSARQVVHGWEGGSVKGKTAPQGQAGESPVLKVVIARKAVGRIGHD